MHAAGTAYTDQKYHFYRNGNKLTNDSDIPVTVHFFSRNVTKILREKNHLVNKQSRKSWKSVFNRKCSAPETFFGVIHYTY